MIPGEYILSKSEIEINKGKERISLIVSNRGDRPIQVGSHFHFFEVNKDLVFDRAKAFGQHLDIAAGTAVRFEPGQEKQIYLVEFGGRKAVYGLNALTEGLVNDPNLKTEALKMARERQFGGA